MYDIFTSTGPSVDGFLKEKLYEYGGSTGSVDKACPTGHRGMPQGLSFLCKLEFIKPVSYGIAPSGIVCYNLTLAFNVFPPFVQHCFEGEKYLSEVLCFSFHEIGSSLRGDGCQG